MSKKWVKLLIPDGEFDTQIKNSEFIKEIVDKLQEVVPSKILNTNSRGVNSLIYDGVISWLTLSFETAILDELDRRQEGD